jgi:hypothetical protein
MTSRICAAMLRRFCSSTRSDLFTDVPLPRDHDAEWFAQRLELLERVVGEQHEIGTRAGVDHAEARRARNELRDELAWRGVACEKYEAASASIIATAIGPLVGENDRSRLLCPDPAGNDSRAEAATVSGPGTVSFLDGHLS